MKQASHFEAIENNKHHEALVREIRYRHNIPCDTLYKAGTFLEKQLLLF